MELNKRIEELIAENARIAEEKMQILG